MTWIRALLWLLPLRLRSYWVLLAVSAFGILAAVTIMSVGAIYSRTLAEGGLRHALASVNPMTMNAQLIVHNRPMGHADYKKLRSTVEGKIEPRLGHLQRDLQRYGIGHPNAPIIPVLDGSPAPLGAPLAKPFFVTEFEEHTRIIDGRWPNTTPKLHERGLDMEVAMGVQAADAVSMTVGSQGYILPYRNDQSEYISFTVVGLMEPIDSSEEYWMGTGLTYFTVDLMALQDETEVVPVPMYLPEGAFFSGLGEKFRSMVANYGWLVFLDTTELTASQVGPTIDALTGLETDINKEYQRSFLLSRLDRVLEDFETDLTLARVPLFLFISMVVVVILYFLAMVMGMLARIRSDEASLLRSRGASMLQVTGLLALGEGLIVLVAMAAGPFLALAIVRYLLLRTVNPSGEGGAIAAGLSADMFIMGAIGAVLSLGVLMASGLSLARLGMVEFLRVRARPPTVPFLQRYYIDLLVLAAVGLVFWQIQDREGFIGRDVLGTSLEVDSSLLLGPVLVLLAAALLLLRFLPLLMRLLAWVGSHIAPVWATFAIYRVARDPLPHGSLTVILMMATALGIFGATFQSTLARNQEEQALYNMGGNLVITAPSISRQTQSELAEVDGVRAVSPVDRIPVTLIDGFADESVSLVAVDPDTLPDTIWFRDDFAGKSLSQLLKPFNRQENTLPVISLPEGTGTIGIWVNDAGVVQKGGLETLNLWMRVADALGRFNNLFLGQIPPPGSKTNAGEDDAESSETPLVPAWTYFETPLPGIDSSFVQPPFSLVSIFITGNPLSRMPPGSIDLDDITVKGPSFPADGLVVEGYEDAGPWKLMPNVEQVADTVLRTPQSARSGSHGLTFSWRDTIGDIGRGILIPPGPYPLPAIGGPMFEPRQKIRMRVGENAVPIIIEETTDYFPTLDPTFKPFLLVSQEDYRQYIAHLPRAKMKPSSEVWASLDSNVPRGTTISFMKEHLTDLSYMEDSDTAVDHARRNPLAGGGWNGLTILSITALTIAIVLALSTYAAVSVYTSRVDLTVVRAMGLSKAQLILSLAMERVIVVVLGLAAGSALGIWLSRWVLGFLDVDSSGEPVLPPMIVTVHDGIVGLVFLCLAAALVIAVLFASTAAQRLRPSDILRVGS